MEQQAYVSLTALSRRIGLSATWLKAEAEADRVPHLRVGRRLMFNAAEVERVLLDRARLKGDRDLPAVVVDSGVDSEAARTA